MSVGLQFTHRTLCLLDFVGFFNISQRGGVMEEEDTQWGTKLEEKVSSVLRPTHPILLKGI